MKTLWVAFACAVLLTGCSSAGNVAQASGGNDTNKQVTIQGIAFTPQNLTVPAGTTVTWTNKDPVKHTVTSGKPGRDAIPGVSKGTAPKLTGVFDHAMSPSGATFSFKFTKPGTYPYFCRIHTSLRGVITVR
jgi:plastocyanin